jgi:hypothetical protein
MTLDMTLHQYKVAVTSFAKDLRLTRQYYGDDPTPWLEGGLIKSADDLPELFASLDAVLFMEAMSGGTMREAYEMHRQLLSFLHHLEGSEPVDLPDVPPSPTLESMHASFKPATSD